MGILEELDAARDLLVSRQASAVANTNEAFRRAVIALEDRVEELARNSGARAGGDFSSNLNRLKQEGLIAEERFRRLHRIRELRNCVFHNELDVPPLQAAQIITEIEAFVRATSTDIRGLMTRTVYSVEPASPLSDAEAHIFRHGVSHIPVTDGEQVVGLITELTVIRAHRQRHGSAAPPATQTVAEVMEALPPQVQPDASIEQVLDLLDSHTAVIVIQDGKLVGIITRWDLVQKFWLHPE